MDEFVSSKEEDPRLRTRIFEKGMALYESGKVATDGEIGKAAYFKVEGDHEEYKVRIESNGTFSCTCMRGSLQGATKGSMCSHVVAVILSLAHRDTK